MKKIENINLVSDSNQEDFFMNLGKQINNFQDKGYIVDVQYSTTAINFYSGQKIVYSALLLAYKEN